MDPIKEAYDRRLYERRRAVAEWFRVRAKFDPRVKGTPLEPIFWQLAADADHSSLLLRLPDGKPALPEPPPLDHAYPVYPDD